jgi:hypothetical protein
MTDRLIDRAPLRRVEAWATGTLGTVADHTRADLDNNGFAFPVENADLPRFGLGGPRPAAGIGFALAAAASGARSLANDAAATVRVYGEQTVAGAGYDRKRGRGGDAARVRLLATLAVTFGNRLEDIWVGRDADSGGQARQVRWADTVALTLSPYGEALLTTAYQSPPVAYSPGGDLVAEFIMPQLPTLSAVVIDAEAATDADLFIDARLVG